ncbi:MAG: DNA replication and repair protein RecF [Coriobacteriia bacterium]|jgi:DNA replication and repair protein RecF|nr:DNA replication and repair protein RecF [Coriobacteriia bacterium]
MKGSYTFSCQFDWDEEEVSGLRVLSIQLARFRNHIEWSSELSDGLTVLVGRNAAGKTNVLEGIIVSATGTSFRSFSWEDLVLQGEEGARVCLSAERDAAPLEITLDVDSGGTRRFSVNGRVRKKLSDVAGRVPVVAFVPEDLLMSKGPAESRRIPLDALGDRLSRAYSAIRMEYARLVKQRNVLLRQGAADNHLDPWDEMVASVGASLAWHRTHLLARLEPTALEAYGLVSDGERLEMVYAASWAPEPMGISEAASLDKDAIREAVAEGLERERQKERDRGATLMGPHRDDISFLIDGRSSRAFASQGQHRTIALAWKMAEVAVVEQVSGVRPLLLLDDVMSEFDEVRRDALSRYVMGGPQTVLTTTNLTYFSEELLGDALVVRLGNG